MKSPESSYNLAYNLAILAGVFLAASIARAADETLIPLPEMPIGFDVSNCQDLIFDPANWPFVEGSDVYLSAEDQEDLLTKMNSNHPLDKVRLALINPDARARFYRGIQLHMQKFYFLRFFSDDPLAPDLNKAMRYQTMQHLRIQNRSGSKLESADDLVAIHYLSKFGKEEDLPALRGLLRTMVTKREGADAVAVAALLQAIQKIEQNSRKKIRSRFESSASAAVDDAPVPKKPGASDD